MSKNIFREVLKKIAKPKANKKVISFQNTTINKVESNKKTIENIFKMIKNSFISIIRVH